MINDLVHEAARAVVWTLIGLFPLMFGLAVNMWADIRSLRKAMNSAFQKIRALEGDSNTKGRE